MVRSGSARVGDSRSSCHRPPRRSMLPKSFTPVLYWAGRKSTPGRRLRRSTMPIPCTRDFRRSRLRARAPLFSGIVCRRSLTSGGKRGSANSISMACQRANTRWKFSSEMAGADGVRSRPFSRFKFWRPGGGGAGDFRCCSSCRWLWWRWFRACVARLCVTASATFFGWWKSAQRS